MLSVDVLQIRGHRYPRFARLLQILGTHLHLRKGGAEVKADEIYAEYLEWLKSIGLLNAALNPLQYEEVTASIKTETPNNTDAILRNNNQRKDKRDK